MKKVDKNEKNNSLRLSGGIALGLCFGVAYGIIFHNLALGIGIGLCFGTACGITFSSNKKNNDKDEQNIKHK